jgi:hypothetical protein
MITSSGADGFAVEQQQNERPGERHRLLAEHHKARAQCLWQRGAQTGLSDTHRYRGQAMALRERAARLRFPEIQVKLLAIAQKYESMADYIERGSCVRPFGKDRTRDLLKSRALDRAT